MLVLRKLNIKETINVFFMFFMCCLGPRIRRPIKKQDGGEISMPVQRPNSQIRQELLNKIAAG